MLDLVLYLRGKWSFQRKHREETIIWEGVSISNEIEDRGIYLKPGLRERIYKKVLFHGVSSLVTLDEGN